MTDVVHNAIESMTGHRPSGCPWSVLSDPFVQRVIIAHEHREKGSLALAYPRPSHRLIEGLTFYSRTLESLDEQQLEQDRKQREIERPRHGR
jgi:hypothetical protein